MKNTRLNLDAFDVDIASEDGVDDSVEIMLDEDGLSIPGDANVVGVTFVNHEGGGQIDILLHVERNKPKNGIKYSTIRWPEKLRDSDWVMENYFP